MNKVGFIGYGSMGSTLINGFLSSERLRPEDIVVSTRTKSKLAPLIQRWAGIRAADNNRSAAQASKTLFLCVKPLDILPVLDEMSGDLSDNETHLVSIAASVEISDMERLFKGMISKVIPSLTAEVKEGVSLICHNTKVDNENAAKVENLFQSISSVFLIDEMEFETAADLTSCATGLMAAIFENFVESALKYSRLSREDAQRMAVSTLLGTSRLLLEQGMCFSELISRVATKGGITEEGVKVLNQGLPRVFDELFDRTLNKHSIVKRMVKDRKPGQG